LFNARGADGQQSKICRNFFPASVFNLHVSSLEIVLREWSKSVMKNFKITALSFGTMLILLALATAAGAQQGKQIGSDLQAGIDSLKQDLRGLNLTEAQREEIRAILKVRQPEVREARKALLESRIALLNDDPNGPAKFGAAQTKIMAFRQSITNQIMAKLTADQIAIMEKRRQRQSALLERRLKRLQQ
jgi:Spy/CpxP family protein refolding chaperone